MNKFITSITLSFIPTFLYANPIQMDVSVDTIQAPSAYRSTKITENRLDSINVYKLAKSAYKLRINKMLSNELIYSFNHDHGKLKGSLLNIIEHCSKIYNLDKELIAAVIMTESGFNHQALSKAGAQGLMQLMPETASYLQVKDPYDPLENIMAGSRYLKEQINKFKSLELSLAAYNAGPNNVIKYKGIPPFAETQGFVQKVFNYYQIYQKQGISF